MKSTDKITDPELLSSGNPGEEKYFEDGTPRREGCICPMTKYVGVNKSCPVHGNYKTAESKRQELMSGFDTPSEADYIAEPEDKEKQDDQIDFRLLEEYDMKDKLGKTITHCLTKMPEENRKDFIVNLCNGMIGSAILHHHNRYVKKLTVPDFKTTFK